MCSTRSLGRRAGPGIGCGGSVMLSLGLPVALLELEWAWAEMSRTNCTKVFLAGHRLRGFQSDQDWGCLGRTAQSGVYRGSAGTVAAFPGWRKHLDCAPTCSIKVKGKCKKWHFLERLLVVFHPFGRHYRVSQWISFTYSLGAL